ncbi:GMC family oxidoreductase [Citricoccus sp. K5]|uniref:GMC family oxidoreductase n=1 Tax=Citricoccus sp. K5 TaxID=2653135 RepID=UPI0012F2EEE5|nr:GMC family oxidoreductase [Citricoccus sp. K5]VXB29828.1 Choline dehydrogenase-like flavoprotein [Citricoccus sp. K5]
MTPGLVGSRAGSTDPPAAARGLTADVIVVGAGAAGCAMAAALAEDPDLRVLVVEAGPWNRNPLVSVPKGFVRTMFDPRISFEYPALPAQEPGPVDVWRRGRGVGGSTLINGTMYLRGESHLYDVLADHLGQDWSWRAFGRAFDHLEALLPVSAPAAEPSSGPPSEVLSALIAGLGETRVPFVPDVRAAVGPRVGHTPATIRGRMRRSAATLLRTGLRAGNLRVLTGQTTVRVLTAGDRAVGVETVLEDGSRIHHHARHQVVLTAGTLETPPLLERSGIGDPDRLRHLGIDPVVSAPRVGEGLREQRGATIKARIRPGLGLNGRLGTTRGLLGATAQYLVTRSGPLSSGPYPLAASVDSTGGNRPDLQLLLTDISTDGTGLAPADHAGLMIQAYALSPYSTGSVHAASTDPHRPADVRAPLLEDPRDRAAAARALMAARAVLAAPALSDVVIDEDLPGASVADGDDAAAANFVRTSGGGIYHAVGTCAAGGPDSVVDEHLRVRGIDGLHVADLSALPTHPSGGTAAVAMALGHLAGTRIREDR